MNRLTHLLRRMVFSAAILLAMPVFAKMERPPSSDGEIDTLLNRIDNKAPAAATSPGTESRAFGPFQYGVSGAGKLLPDISVIGTMAAGYLTDDPAGDVGHDPRRTGFTIQEFEIGFQSAIDPYFRGDVFVAIHEDAVELEEGFLTTLGLVKGLQVKAGKFLVPFGRQNAKHLELWGFVDNTLVNKYLLDVEGLNEIGVGAAYVFPLPFYLQLESTFVNGDNGASFNSALKKDFLYQGRLTTSFDLSPVTTVLIGSSAATGNNASGLGNTTTLFGGDVFLKWKPSARLSLAWQSEFIYRGMEIPGLTQKDGGFYSYADLQFAKRWHAGLRYDQMGLPDDSIAREFRVTPMFAFDPTEFSRLRVQYEYDKAVNNHVVHGAFLQAEFNMGPHGAHPF